MPDPAARHPIRPVLRDAAERLKSAGIGSADAEARLLLAHVLDVEPGRLGLVDAIDDHQLAAFQTLLSGRAERIPLQHLTGLAYFRYEVIQVGPGVFVPRPETEVMTGWAVEQLNRLMGEGHPPLVVELCAGSGAISKALVHEVPGVIVHAVEMSDEAAVWAMRNLADTGVELHVEDMADTLPELDGLVDLVIANPPYIPLDAFESVDPEVRDHDPPVALFSGDDGLDAIRVVARVAMRLLREGGLVCAEHAELQADTAPAVFADTGSYRSVQDHHDLAARPRFVTAVRLARR